MNERPPPPSAARYVRWLVRRTRAILAISAALVGVAVYLAAFHLPLHADFSHLLPQDAPAVRDLRALERRVTSQDTLLVLVRGDDPARRAAAADAMGAAIRGLPPSLVGRLEDDDADTRAFLRAHRHVLAPLEDLEAARDALADRIRQAKLDANPLYVDLDDDATAADGAAAAARLDELRARRAEAEARLDRSGHLSPDGALQLLIVRTGFSNTDVASGQRLIAALEAARRDVLASHPGVEIGITAGVASTVAEHEALVRGILWSAAITGLLVAGVLGLYLRSARLLALLSVTLAAGTAVSFGVAALAVGRLNAATAFLGAIIAGNGVNYGVLLLARYLEERRGRGPEAAMAAAIHGTLRPTIVASLGASIAYGSLAATSFRGFADFAVIGGIGMLLCWVASYTLLPALVLRWARRTHVPLGEPVLGRVIARLLAFRRAGVVCAVAALIAAGAGAIAYRYIADDPFEYDITKLRSDGDGVRELRRWAGLSDRTFGRGVSGQAFLAADRPDQVPMIVDALRRVDAGVPEHARAIGPIRSILDVLPPDQDARLAALAELRALLDDEALDALDPEERAELDALRPPDDLRAITPGDLPEQLATKLRERDGRLGLLVAVNPHDQLDEWDGRDLIRFAGAIRRLDLASGETLTTSGSQVIFADIVQTIRDDGPVVIGTAGVALVLMVLIVVGRNVRAVAVLVATGLGSLLLVAVCAVIGIKVTFLDFVALPITLGLGVDYAINVAHRHSEDARGAPDPARTLRTSGAAVFLCSLTTIIGYGSLLVSENLAIRGFGAASLIGEICCVLTALVVVPAIVGLAASRRRAARLAPQVALGQEPPVAR